MEYSQIPPYHKRRGPAGQRGKGDGHTVTSADKNPSTRSSPATTGTPLLPSILSPSPFNPFNPFTMSLPPNVHVSTHPCLQAKLSQLRSQNTTPRETRALVQEIASILGVEAFANGLKLTKTGTVGSSFSYKEQHEPYSYPYPYPYSYSYSTTAGSHPAGSRVRDAGYRPSRPGTCSDSPLGSGHGGDRKSVV